MLTESILLELMLKNGLTIEKAAKKLNIPTKTLQKKFDQNKIHFTEVKQIFDIIGYKMEFIDKDYLK